MDAVRHYGSDLFHALNQMRLPMDALRQRFSLGGFVDALTSVRVPQLRFADGGMVPALAGGGAVGPGHILNLTIGNETFAGLIMPSNVFDN